MITIEQIESLGWVVRSIAKNGGSKRLQKGEFVIYSHADNFIMKKASDDRISEIILYRLEKGKPPRIVELFVGKLETIEGLIDILILHKADVEFCREYRLNQILDNVQ